MKPLGSLAEGTIVKLYENGKLAEFVVATHDYESGMNGTGHTLLVRADFLEEKQYWTKKGHGSDMPKDISWWSDSSLKTWLETTYYQQFSEETRARIRPITITAKSYWGTKKVANSTIFVPNKTDLDDTVQSILAQRLPVQTYFWLRNADGSTSTDSYGNEYDYGYIYTWYVTNKKTFYSYSTNTNNSYSKYSVLPCFAMYDDVQLDDDGILWANRVPVISSYQFGTESVHGKRLPFRVPYSVHDEDGDTITITEYLNDTVVRTYTAVDGATNYFTITQEMLDAASTDSDQVMKVSATDGMATTEKTYRFHKVIGSGYKVYIGKITGSTDGTGYYWTERNLLHDAGNEDAPIVLDPEVTLEANEPGSFSFTVPRVNPYYEKIALKQAVISVEEDGNEIFMGRVTDWNKTFDLDMEVTCEGELSYLEDRDCIIEEKTYTSTELLTLAVTADSRFAQEGKAFNLGTVTKEKTGTDAEEKETKTISDCWSVAKDYLADKYGGYLRLRKTVTMENGVRVYRRYLDYMDMPPDQTDQVIQFGVNLLDISYSLRSNQIVNSIVVIGYETTGWFIFTSTNEIRVEVKNEDSIKEFGLCQRYMTVDGTKSTRESLLKKGEEELKKKTDQFEGSITVNAADLADIGVDTDRLEFMKQARIISEAHGLKNWVLCTKEVIPLDAPEEKEFTFGETSQNLSALQAKNFGTAGKAWNAIQSTIKYVKSGG